MIPAALLLLFGAAQNPTVEWRDGELWLVRDGAPPLQLTHDGCEKDGAPSWSPDGTRIAYYTYTTVDKPQCQNEVILLSADGTRLLTIPALDLGNSVTNIEWLGNNRIGIDTHINPSLGQYRIVDATTGGEISSYTGFGFVPSPDFTLIAHAGWISHFGPPFAKSGYLMVNDRIIYPAGDGRAPYLARTDPLDPLLFRDIREFVMPLVWSPDGTRIAIVERLFDWRADAPGSYQGKEENSRWQLVVVPVAGGTALRYELPETVRSQGVRLRWKDSERIAIAGGGFEGEYPKR